MDMDGENGRGFDEYEWAGQKRIRATALLEGGFRGTNTHRPHAVLCWVYSGQVVSSLVELGCHSYWCVCLCVCVMV